MSFPGLPTQPTWWFMGGTLVGSDGDPVVTWSDDGTLGLSVTNANAAKRPTLQTSELNGHSVVRFGPDDVLWGNAILSQVMTAGAGTVFTVVKPTSITTNAANPWENNAAWGDQNRYNGLVFKSATPSVLSWLWDGSAGGDVAEKAITLGEWFIHTYLHAGNTLYSGTTDTRTASMQATSNANSVTNLTGVMNIGSHRDLAVSENHLRGDLAEVIFFNYVLTEVERQQVETYLAVKYGFTLPYPPPTSDGLAQAFGATKEVTAVGTLTAAGQGLSFGLSSNAGVGSSRDQGVAEAAGSSAAAGLSNGVWYQQIRVLSEPYDKGPDATGRERCAFSLTALKRPSNRFLEELMTILTSAGVGVVDTNIFAAQEAYLPTGGGPYLHIQDSAGSASLRTQNSFPSPAYANAGATVTVRAADYATARLMARAAYDALATVRNRFVYW